MKRFFEKICLEFQKTIKKIAIIDSDTIAFQGQIIYKSHVGYCYVKSVTKSNIFTLARPGFIWDNKIEEFIRHSQDEIYTPVNLKSFICVDL